MRNMESIPTPTDPDTADRPLIYVNARPFSDVIMDARNVFVEANTPPQYFLYGNVLCRFDPSRSREPAPVKVEHLFGWMAEQALWMRMNKKSATDVKPDRDAIVNLIHNPDPRLPVLERIVAAPVFARDGSLISAPGYDPIHRLYFAPDGNWLRGLQLTATPARIAAARKLLTDELLGDFPFKNQTSLAHTVALLLLCPARDLVDGATPLHAITSPTQGTGKTLLGSIGGAIVNGVWCTPNTLSFERGYGEEEIRRKLTGLLMSGADFVLLDNIHGQVDSSTLASILTATTWSDRLIRTSQILQLPNRATWIATGNNLTTALEIARRSIWIRLDSGEETPWTRKNFRHSDLRSWVLENRGLLLEATLTLVQAWIDAGRPSGKRTLGSFESWSRTIGGILEVAGVPGFLEEEIELSAYDPETVELQSVVAAWRGKFEGSNFVTVSRLLEALLGLNLPLSFLRDGSRHAQLSALGKYLTSIQDRVVDGYRIEGIPDKHTKTWIYRLIKLEKQPS